MHKILIAAMFIFCTADLTNAQRFQLGFKLEFNGVLYSDVVKDRNFSRPVPSELQAHAAFFPIEQLALEARAGKEIDSRFYTGNEYGFFARYYLIKDVYGITGLMIHHILPDSHMSWERYEKTLRMPGLGVGYNPFGDVYLELLYLHTGTQEIGYEKGTDPFTYQGYQKPMKIYWILKFGLGLSFDLYRKQ